MMWTGQRVGEEPAPPPSSIRPCSICARPTPLRRPGLLLWAPVVCRRCRMRVDAEELALRLLCTAGSVMVLWALVYAWLWLGGAR